MSISIYILSKLVYTHTKNLAAILVEIVLNLLISLRINIFSLLSLLIHEHGLSYYLDLF